MSIKNSILNNNFLKNIFSFLPTFTQTGPYDSEMFLGRYCIV